MSWVSKIVRHSKESPSSLTGNPKNHREHPEFQRQAVADSINEVGFIRSITVNEVSGYVLDGHERLWQALAEEERNPKFKVDVEWVHLDEHEEALALAILDATTGLARVNHVRLDELLREINTGSQALGQMLADLHAKSAPGDPEPEQEHPEEQSGPVISDDTVIQIMVNNLPHGTIRDSLVQLALPPATMQKVARLIMRLHPSIFNG